MKVPRFYRYLGLAGALLVPALATAALLDLTVFEGGTTISASEVNANFAALNEKLDQLEATPTRPSAGLFCGLSVGAENGDLGGYVGAKQLCGETAGACGADAHMCTAHELVLSSQEGVSVPEGGWYGAGLWHQDAANAVTDDCAGFTSADPLTNGPAWQGTTVTHVPCSGSRKVICCE